MRKVEREILKKLKEIYELVKKDNYPSQYLSLAIVQSGGGTSLSASNEYYGVDAKKPIDIWLHIPKQEAPNEN